MSLEIKFFFLFLLESKFLGKFPKACQEIELSNWTLRATLLGKTSGETSLLMEGNGVFLFHRGASQFRLTKGRQQLDYLTI